MMLVGVWVIYISSNQRNLSLNSEAIDDRKPEGQNTNADFEDAPEGVQRKLTEKQMKPLKIEIAR